MARTAQALRQAVFTRLTGVSFQVNGTGPAITPAIIPQSIELAGGAQSPAPLVAFAVDAGHAPSRFNIERPMTLQLWCVSTIGPDECTEMYESVRALLHRADDEGSWDGPPSLSRIGTGTTLPLIVRECVEDRVGRVYYETATSRYYLHGTFHIVAV